MELIERKRINCVKRRVENGIDQYLKSGKKQLQKRNCSVFTSQHNFQRNAVLFSAKRDNNPDESLPR